MHRRAFRSGRRPDTELMFRESADGFTLTIGGRLIIRHSPEMPFATLGCGREDIRMYRGNFEIADTVDLRVPLPWAQVQPNEVRLAAERGGDALLVLTLETGDGAALVRLTATGTGPGPSGAAWNR